MAFFVLNARPIESADSSRTIFTMTRPISDTARLQVWFNEPAVQAMVVTPATTPSVNQCRVINSTQIEFGLAPAKTPFVNFFTSERINHIDLILAESLAPTSDPLVWSYQHTPSSVDLFQLFTGKPGVLKIRTESNPNANEYVNNPTAKTVTFNSTGAPRSGDPSPTATYWTNREQAGVACS